MMASGGVISYRVARSLIATVVLAWMPAVRFPLPAGKALTISQWVLVSVSWAWEVGAILG